MVMSSLTWASRRCWRCITSTDSNLMDCLQNSGAFFFLNSSASFSVLWFLVPFFFLQLEVPVVANLSPRRWPLLPVHRCSKTKRNEGFGDTLMTLGPTLLLPFFLYWKIDGGWYMGKDSLWKKCFFFSSLVDMWRDITVSITEKWTGFLSLRSYVM